MPFVIVRVMILDLNTASLINKGLIQRSNSYFVVLFLINKCVLRWG